jgi:hypothetical protein
VANARGEHRFWRRRAPESPAGSPDVLDEVAQFLGGQLLATFSESRESAPDWVWVSVLAHGSEEFLATCAAEGGAPVGSGNRCVWDRTLSFLAQVLLDHAARTGEPLSLLQHDIVLPIELRLGARPLAPPTLVRQVLSGLQARQRSDSDHPAPRTERRT